MTLLCASTEDRPVTWLKNDKNLTASDKRFIVHTDDNDAPRIIHNLTIVKVELSDSGNYTCAVANTTPDVPSAFKSRRFHLRTIVLPRITATSAPVVKTKISQSVHMFCTFEGHPMDAYQPTIKWTRIATVGQKGSFGGITTSLEAVLPANFSSVHRVDETHVNATLTIADVFKKDNGTYTCSIEAPFIDDDTHFNDNRKVSKDLAVLVLDAPQVSIDYVQAVGASKIFLNWTVNDGNEPVKQYFVQYQKEGAQTFTYYNHIIDGKNLSYVLENFEPNSVYHLKITAQNSIGSSPPYTYPTPIRTLDKDPVFIPEIGVKGGHIHNHAIIGSLLYIYRNVNALDMSGRAFSPTQNKTLHRFSVCTVRIVRNAKHKTSRPSENQYLYQAVLLNGLNASVEINATLALIR